MRDVCFLTSHSSITEQLQSDILEAAALFGKAITSHYVCIFKHTRVVAFPNYKLKTNFMLLELE